MVNILFKPLGENLSKVKPQMIPFNDINRQMNPNLFSFNNNLNINSSIMCDGRTNNKCNYVNNEKMKNYLKDPRSEGFYPGGQLNYMPFNYFHN